MKLPKNYIPFVATTALLLVGTIAEAQFPGGGTAPPGGTPACWPPPCVPIDGGLGLLIAAGVAFGSKKLFDMKKA